MKKPRQTIDERTSGRNNQFTPDWLVKQIATVSDIGIGLDPCGSKRAPAAKYARQVMTGPRGSGDGLALVWRGHGLVFCNPEYGTRVRLWAKKAIAEFGFAEAWPRGIRAWRGDELIMLVAARVDTRWFKLLWRHASAVLLFDRRLTFVGEKDPAKFPSALLYFGLRQGRFANCFREFGLVIANIQPELDHPALLESRNVRLHFPPDRVRAVRAKLARAR